MRSQDDGAASRIDRQNNHNERSSVVWKMICDALCNRGVAGALLKGSLCEDGDLCMLPADDDERRRGEDVASCRLIYFVIPMHDENRSKSNMLIALSIAVLAKNHTISRMEI